MKSRVNKYESSNARSRTEKNQSLYDDMYSNTDYSNMVVLDDSSEVDINKIKEIIDKEKNETRRSSKSNFNKEEYDSIVPLKPEERKLYDINEVLKEAKNNRNIIEEASEKSKIENYKFKNIEEELSKTRKVYENLIKEEKELLNIMNTMTNMDSDAIANDMFQDLTNKDDLTEVLEIDNPNPVIVKDNQEQNVGVKQIDEDSTEYSTDTFMFNTKDFEGMDDLKSNVKRTGMFIKILIIIVVLMIIVALAIAIFKLR